MCWKKNKKLVQIVGIYEPDALQSEANYHYDFVCPHCNKQQPIHTNLQSRHGDLGGYQCPFCGHKYHCTTDDGGCSKPKIYIFDGEHQIATLELPKLQNDSSKPEIEQGKYTPNMFKTTLLLNDGPIYIELGYFDTRKGRIYALGYDKPKNNEDYFEFGRITEEQWRCYKDEATKQLDREEASQWYLEHFEGLQILCNEFPEESLSKPYFTDDEI